MEVPSVQAKKMRYPVLTEKYVAARWSISTKTLRRWRLDGVGPTWHKLFRLVRYHESDLIEFERRGAQFWGGVFGERVARALDAQVAPKAGTATKSEQPSEAIYVTADEAAAGTSLPIHIFRDRAERERKKIPHLMLVGNLRFSLDAILDWELATSVPGKASAAAAAVAKATEELQNEPPVQVRRWNEIAPRNPYEGHFKRAV